jgi:hypothetical protein
MSERKWETIKICSENGRKYIDLIITCVYKYILAEFHISRSISSLVFIVNWKSDLRRRSYKKKTQKSEVL